MKYVILFRDAADADPDIRKAHMAAHLAFLEENAAAIDAAGPLSDPDGQGRDGLWIVEATDEAEIERLIHTDPFWPTGLRDGYSILRWTQVFAYGSRQVPPR